MFAHFLACERQTFLLAHRHWGTFREEESQIFLLGKRLSAAMSEEKLLPFAAYPFLEILYHRNLGDAVTKLQRFVWLFTHVSKVITWSPFNLRAPNLVKWPISTWPFIWWCQFSDYFKFVTRPSSLRNSEMANTCKILACEQALLSGPAKWASRERALSRDSPHSPK